MTKKPAKPVRKQPVIAFKRPVKPCCAPSRCDDDDCTCCGTKATFTQYHEKIPNFGTQQFNLLGPVIEAPGAEANAMPDRKTANLNEALSKFKTSNKISESTENPKLLIKLAKLYDKEDNKPLSILALDDALFYQIEDLLETCETLGKQASENGFSELAKQANEIKNFIVKLRYRDGSDQ